MKLETARLDVAIKDFIVASDNLNQALKAQYLRFLREGLEDRHAHVLLRTTFLELMSLKKVPTFVKSHLHLVWSFWQPPEISTAKKLASK